MGSKRRSRLERVDAHRWLLPRRGGMRAEGMIYASDELMVDIEY